MVDALAQLNYVLKAGISSTLKDLFKEKRGGNGLLAYADPLGICIGGDEEAGVMSSQTSPSLSLCQREIERESRELVFSAYLPLTFEHRT
jgi:hypothetical protein